MIVPISKKDISIGDNVLVTSEISSSYYNISIGHEFSVVDFDSSYSVWICLDSESGYKFRIDGKYLTKKIDIFSAEKEFIYNEEVHQYKEYIRNRCPHRDCDWMFDSCCLREGIFGDSCEPSLECVKYLDDFSGCRALVKHLRMNKLDRIQDRE